MAALNIPEEWRRRLEKHSPKTIRIILFDGHANIGGLPDELGLIARSGSEARRYAIEWLSWKQLPWWKRLLS